MVCINWQSPRSLRIWFWSQPLWLLYSNKCVDWLIDLNFTSGLRLFSPNIIPAKVCLHLYIVGSLVHSIWLYSHFHFTIIVTESFHLLYCLLWFLLCMGIIIHQVPLLPSSFYVHSKSPHSFSLLFLISSFHLYKYFYFISHFIYVMKSYNTRSMTYG